MACPFAPRRSSDEQDDVASTAHHAALTHQGSSADIGGSAAWTLDEECADVQDDALTLSHLQEAILLLTAPAVCYYKC